LAQSREGLACITSGVTHDVMPAERWEGFPHPDRPPQEPCASWHRPAPPTPGEPSLRQLSPPWVSCPSGMLRSRPVYSTPSTWP